MSGLILSLVCSVDVIVFVVLIFFLLCKGLASDHLGGVYMAGDAVFGSYYFCSLFPQRIVDGIWDRIVSVPENFFLTLF